ncbi:CLUMA_CG021374, isoform B [Clunio marinus]|uniref:CLUMA_CG021374, isoform B n=1 Tax=Clunio marinus TaxID=568069 RepID=A0A1J1J793_9DIPT|nr:CLUMA_CG021374, isoform B [Clunio marinus]
MEADVLNALKSRVAYLSGGRDHDSNLLIIFQLPYELQPWTKRYIELSTKYLLSSLSQQTLNNGLIAIVDSQKCSWRLARDLIKLITQSLDTNLIKLFAIRTEAFSMQNCAKSYKKGEPIIISKSRLNKFFNLSELPNEIGGFQNYNHDEWIRNRVQIDEFKKHFETIVASIKSLKENLANTSTMRSQEIEQTIKICSPTYSDVQKSIKTLLDNGNKLISQINDWQCRESLLSQDILDAKEIIKNTLNDIEKKQTEVCNSWNELEKCLGDAREFSQLEEGVSYVTNWILTTAESLLNGQLKVGYDIQSAEKLRLDHEILEFQCWKTYGSYGELLYKIDHFPGCKDSFAYKDLLSQRDFMDFVCRSFATRLERRRNLLITSVRFYRLVAEYFQRTSNVFESLLQTQKENVDNFELAKGKLHKIKESQQSLGNVEKELVKEGEKLSDILSMPIKDALGRDIDVDYSEDIASLREVLDAAKTRFKIFSDSMDLQKLTLEQITHIHCCEKDAEMAVKWVESLYKVMLKSHTVVGCNVSEIQNQKDEHQAFQDTAKSTFNYGIQLLNAAFALRQSCKLSSDSNLETIDHLKKMWKNLHAVSQEQMTRLRVSAVFYRSVDEHCTKLEQLKASVIKLKEVEDEEKQILKLRKYLAVRERLLLEVGRMMRLGRLLRTRLKEPFFLNNDLENMSSEENVIAMPGDNSIAADSISAKLIEVSRVAESLDNVLHEMQDDLNIFESTMSGTSSTTTPSTTVERKISSANNSDDWNSSLKSSTEDESFVTASEYTPSRSSSYHTASECRGTSPWTWNESAERSSVDFDSSDPEQISLKPLTTTLSANASFDDSENSFLSPIPFGEQTEHDNAPPPLPPKNSSPLQDISEPTHNQENRIYTIFESPTTSPSEIDSLTEGECGRKALAGKKLFTIWNQLKCGEHEVMGAETGNSLQIKVAEVIPKFTFLGKNLDEALKLQKQHEELMLNIQNLPSPLEEFYRKVQEKIAAQEEPNPRLIEDMADSLNIVWADIQKMLHERRLIINLNVAFFERLGECYGKMSALEVACRDTMIPIEVEAVRDYLEKFKHLRMEVLSSVMNPLTVGNQLLEKLKEMVNYGTLDSRPDHILEESKRSVTLVETWLEDLSDKRNNLETAWLCRKVQLEQCLILAQLTKDLSELEKILNKQKDEILGTFTLGDNSRQAQSLQQEYETWKVDAIALRDKALKITRATEEVVKQGSFIGEEACSKAYSVLANCTEYFDEIDLRESLLEQSKEFFRKAENVLKQLDDLERDLKNVSMRPGSPNFISVHLKLMQEVSTAITKTLELGYSLIDEVGRTKPEVAGVQRVVDEIERRKIYLDKAFSKTSEKHIKVSEELSIFLQQYNDIFSWIESQKKERIISGPINFMGNNAHQAKDCLNSHQQLLRELEIKDEEFKNLNRKVSEILEFVEDSQRNDVNEKIHLLLKNSSDFNNFLTSRIPVIELYLRFHQEADHLTNLFSNLEQTLKTKKRSEDFHYIDTVWSKIQTQFTVLKNIAKHFTAEKTKVADSYLQVDRAENCIEKTLDAFSRRQLEISDVWEHWNITKEINIVLEQVMAENIETLSLTAKIEDELYPILATSEELPSELIRFVGNKLKTVLNEIQQAERELSARIDKIDKLEANDEVSNEKIVQVKNNLNSIKTKLFSLGADYSELVDVILGFLRAYQDVYESIRAYFADKNQPSPLAENVESLIRDYETFKSNTMEHFRSLLAQSEKIIDRIKMQEPPGSKEHDADKIITLLEKLRVYFESNASSENSELKRQYFITEFEKMLTDLNDNISDLDSQFNDMQDKFGESAAASKVASLSYEYFERNVDLLNKRIENFISSYKNSNISYPDTKPFIDGELTKLQNRWDEFRDKSLKLKNSLSLAQQYFSLLDIIDTRYHKTYTFLVNSVNLRKDELRSSDSAFQLIDEIEKYVMENKEKQIDDLKKLSKLSKDVFGVDKTENLYSDNVFIFESFEKIKSDIVDIVKDLKAKEDPVAMINEIDKNILVIESTEEVMKIENVHEIVPVVEGEPPKFVRYLESAEVTEGEDFTFECIVKGTPEPSIKWLKYSSPLVENQKCRTTYSDGKCRLEILDVSSFDAAVFSCIATNNSGTAQTTANLIVNEESSEKTNLAPPTFIRLLQNAYANENSSFEFNCLVTGNPLPTVQWYRNDNCVDSNSNYNITYNNGLASLQIPSLKIEDQGIFTVKASNQVGHNECSAILSVEAIEKHQSPSIKLPLANVATNVGQQIKLECNVVGNPRPEIIWMHNGKLLSDDVNLQYDGERLTLTIPKATTKSSGIYRLTANNIAGEASTECYVTVEKPIVINKEVEAIKPSVQLPLKDISVFEGKPLRLDCIIVGHPEPEVIWLQNENPIKESNDIQLYFQGDSCTLLISEAFIEDAGVYKVVAINSAGKTSSECRVTVTPLNIAEPLVRPSSDRLSTNEMPPKFEKLLTDNFANEGETIELECCLASGPLPDIKWYLNNKEISYNDRIQPLAQEDGTLKLIIKNVLPEDKGVYTVKATDSTGVAKCFSHLIVKSTANSSDVQLFQPEPEEKQVSPTFKELFSDRSVNFQDSTKFECIVYGKPTPKIKWLYNDQPVQGKDFLVSRSGDRQVLIMPCVTQENVGKITCVAENEAGKATCVAVLTMSGIPMSTEQQFTTQEDKSGSSLVTMQKQITTTTTTKQSNQFGNGTPQSQFHSTSEQIDSSYKKVGDSTPEVSETKKFEEFRESSDEPPQTFAQKILNFTKNESTENVITHSGGISTGKPVRRNIAPRFVTPLIGKIVDQGVDVVLEGIVDGYPVPTLEITKNGEKIETIPGVIEITYNLNKINIKLYNVMTKDAGRYSAIAKNEAGSATSTADLVVKKSIFPPVFGRRLQAQVVKIGERVIMDVEITGTPEPRISWYKEDRPLMPGMISEYKLAQVGNCYKLILENAKVQDSGKYMVKAENSGGEAQSIADFLVMESQPDRMVEITKTVVFSDLPQNQVKSDQTKIQNGTSKENYSSHQEVKSQAQLGSSTESKVILETTRTTSATMRMEHKANFPDLPVTFSQRTQTPTIPLVSEGTMMDSEVKREVKKQTDSTQTPQAEPAFKPQVPTAPPSSQSIPFPFSDEVPVSKPPEPLKKTALEFFESNLKNLPPLQDDKYTRYEDVVKSSKQYVHKQNTVKEQFQSKLTEDLSFFNLKPEPPPEMGFMPKVKPTQPERLVEKVKKLEEVHQSSETPLSGTVLPQSYKKEEKFERKEFVSTKAVATSPFLQQKPLSPLPQQPSYSPQINRDKLLTSDPKLTRSPSPKPSAEAVNMEKLWAMKTVKSPEPFSHHQQSFSHEHKSSFVAYSSHQSQSQSQQQTLPSKEVFVPIQPYPVEAPPATQEQQQEEEIPKVSIKDTRSFFEQRIKQEEVKSIPELKAPGLVKQFAKPMVPLIPLELEPGSPPEICYAPKPVLERTQSYVEKIEKSLEQNLDKEPERVPPGGVRIIPTRQTPQRMPSPPKVQPQTPVAPQIPPITPITPNIIKPEPINIKSNDVVDFSSSQSKQFHSERIEIKKESSTGEHLPGYRHVEPPKFLQRGKSSEPIKTPPFELPKQEPFIMKPEPPKQQFSSPLQQPFSQPPKEVPIAVQNPHLQQHKPISQYQPKPFIPKTNKKFNEFVSETHESHSMYKNFVRSEESTQSSESYFQKIDQPKMIQPPHNFLQTEPQKQQFLPQQQQESKTTQMMKNISMTNKQIKINEEPISIQYSDEPSQKTNIQPAPSPSKFVKGEFRESEYESDYDSKIQSMWRPSSGQSDQMYKSVTPNLSQTPQKFSSQFKTPPPPSSFESPRQFSTGPPSRPKFEPIEKVQVQQTKKVEQKQKVFKPTPVTPARSSYNSFLENTSQQSNQTKSYYYTSGPQTTTYYTAVAGQPVHNAIAQETSNTMHMKESTEKSHRVVNITQTRRVISLDGSKKQDEKLEPFPYSPDPQSYYQKQRVPPPPTPTKFIPGEFRESDYDSELENAKIRPVWTPNPSDNEDLHYRRVRPPSSRSSSVPRSYERVMTPMEFDTAPVVMPTKIKVDSPSLKTPQQFFSALYRDQNQSKQTSRNVTRDDINIQTRYAPKTSLVDHASSQINSMNTAFKSKAHQFMKDVISDQRQQKPILKKANSVNEGSGAQAYREESRVSQYGTKHVDPDTGIIYFKYDFGYEFGIIFPGEGKKIVSGYRSGNQQGERQNVLPLRTSDIEVPVIHEKSNGRASVVSFGTTTPIEFDKSDMSRKRYSLPSPNYYDRLTPKSGIFQTSDYSGNNYDRSGSGTPSIVNPQKQAPPKHPPLFITPLKDIAVVNGQTARFECIVQCESVPYVYWMKDGQTIENNYKYQIEFRNGVCRLTIPQSYQDDAGTYECVAQNPLGADATRAVLMIFQGNPILKNSKLQSFPPHKNGKQQLLHIMLWNNPQLLKVEMKTHSIALCK